MTVIPLQVLTVMTDPIAGSHCYACGPIAGSHCYACGPIAGSHCFEWLPDAPLDSAVKYTCTGSAAILPWAVSVQPGEEIGEVRWVLAGQSDEVVAVLSQGTFSPMPAFSGRVTHVPNAGLALAHVTLADTGNYSVQVTGRNSAGDQLTLRRSAFLHVLGPLCWSLGFHAASVFVCLFVCLCVCVCVCVCPVRVLTPSAVSVMH